LARLLCLNGNEVVVWSALEREVAELSLTGRHPNLPGMVIPEAVRFTGDIGEACTGRDMVIFAVPSVYTRQTARAAAPFVSEGQILVDVAKGMEADTQLSLTEVIRDEIGRLRPGVSLRLAALSGPSHAEEVARDLPTTIVSASEDRETAKFVQAVFTSGCMRVYTNPDVKGVELCGALKNIVALAAGIADGLGYGDNAKAALITRGIAEIRRLGVAMGCQERTFGGLAGIGDLIVTATSAHSRNNRAGRLIGQGRAPSEAVREVGMVVEGMNALPAAIALSRRYGVELPIIEAVDRVVNEGAAPSEVVKSLMRRERKTELVESASEADCEDAAPEDRPEGDLRRVLLRCGFNRLGCRDIALLRRARARGDYLIVALPREGGPGAPPYEERKALLEAVRYVDLVVEDGEPAALAAEYGAELLELGGREAACG
jgi:glycerol-3-phosphate dehydrogenase